MTRTVHLHGHDVSTILLHCPITSMTRNCSISAQVGVVMASREFYYSFDFKSNGQGVLDQSGGLKYLSKGKQFFNLNQASHIPSN